MYAHKDAGGSERKVGYRDREHKVCCTTSLRWVQVSLWGIPLGSGSSTSSMSNIMRNQMRFYQVLERSSEHKNVRIIFLKIKALRAKFTV